MLSIHETSSDDIYGTRKQTRRNVTDVISNTHGANLGVQRKTHQTDHAEVTQTLGGAHQPERARRESAPRPGKHRFRVYHYRRRGHPGRAEDGRVRIADGEEGRRRRRIVVGIVAGGGGTEAEFRGGGGGGGRAAARTATTTNHRGDGGGGVDGCRHRRAGIAVSRGS